jgi:YD repeat-containing protein
VREGFDDLNRAVRSEDGLGNMTTRAYDASGNLVCERRPLGGAPLAASGIAGQTVAETGGRSHPPRVQVVK